MIQTNLPMGIYFSKEVRLVFSRLKKEDLERLPPSLIVQTENASIKIDFFKNRVSTYFKNMKKSLELSMFLSIIAKKEPQIPESIHLFTKEYAAIICPKMGYPIGVEELQKGIRELYIGRCILGLGKSMEDHGYNQDAHRVEFIRIAKIIRGLEPVIYLPPII